MIPAPFDYEVAESADHAVALLGQHGEDAKLLAGGHSLLPLMRLRLAAPSVLVDVGRLRDLNYVRANGDTVAIGALSTHEEVHRSEVLREHCPILAHTAGEIGDPQVRHRGTIGGSVAHADPASDIPAVLVALDAEMVVHGPGGDRTVPASGFFRSIFESALGPQDLLTEIRVPVTERGVYLKYQRSARDWATVGVAAAEVGGRVQVALASMGPTPLRASAVEEALAGGASPADAAARAVEGAEPPTDVSASSEYRAHLARVLVRRALEQL